MIGYHLRSIGDFDVAESKPGPGRTADPEASTTGRQPPMASVVSIKSGDSVRANQERHDGAAADDRTMDRDALLRHFAGNGDQPALGGASPGVAQRGWSDRIEIHVLDLGPIESPNWPAVNLVKNILTHPEVWGPTSHDESPDPDKWWPSPFVTYMAALCDGEPIGIFTTYMIHWGLWKADIGFLPWGRGPQVAVASRKALALAFQLPGCHHMIGFVPITNERASRSAVRNGDFEEYCEIPEAYCRDGKWQRMKVMGITKERATEVRFRELALPKEEPQGLPPASDLVREEKTILSVVSMDIDTLRALPARERAFAFQDELKKQFDPATHSITCPLRHFFANGVYVREIFMPAGSAIVGQIHKHQHVAIMVQGDMSIYDETGLQRMKAPQTFISRAGVKRALYIHEDTTFTTIHRMSNPDERDLKELEKEFVAITLEEYEKYLLTADKKSLGFGLHPEDEVL